MMSCKNWPLPLGGTITHIAQDDLPFGGVGASGMGAYHGIEGFRALGHAKGVAEGLKRENHEGVRRRTLWKE